MENSENKKSEAEEDVVIVKDDEEEVEKREVCICAILQKSLFVFSLIYIALFFRKRIIKKKISRTVIQK